MAPPPRTAAYLEAYALWEALQGDAHVQAAAALAPLQELASGQGWQDVAFVCAAAEASYAVVRPGRARPDLAGLLELAEGAPAFEAVALGLEALDAGVRGETEVVLARAGRAVALLDDDHLPPLDRCTAYVVCAAAYCGLSLWELVDELYEHARALVPRGPLPVQAPALAVNRVLVRTEWATGLLETGDRSGGAEQLRRALQAATEADGVRLPRLWREDVDALCTVATLLLDALQVDVTGQPLDGLLARGAEQRVRLAAADDLEVVPLLDAARALALHRVGREAEAQQVAGLLAAPSTSSSTGALSFLAWARAQVCQPQAWAGATGDYARLVAGQRWRSRQAVLVAARSFVQLERLQADHQRLTADLTTDPLTGLANRRAFERWLTQVPRRGACAAILVLDLDRFKQVNDRHGHGVGDDVLREIGGIVGRRVRPGDLAARTGGDEFVVVLDQSGTDPAGALGRARALHRDVAEHDWAQVAPGLRVGMSIGVAVGLLAPGPDQLYRRADAALYAAKADGGVSVAGPTSVRG